MLVEFYNSLLWKLMYQSESWILRERERSRLNATEMKYLRASLGLKLLDKVRNDDIRSRMEKKETVVEEIERGQQQWFGHVARMEENSICKRVWRARVAKDGRGRPRARWDDQIRRMWTKKDLTANEAESATQDRLRWREIWKL